MVLDKVVYNNAISNLLSDLTLNLRNFNLMLSSTVFTYSTVQK